MVATRGTKDPDEGHVRLQFNDKIAGKGLTTDALLKKLKALHTELSQMDQERVDKESLTGARRELTSTSIMLHKDKGVKAYAACCMAELLRLFAPDAPFTAPQLNNMFQFFFRQLYAGFRPDSPYIYQYYHLLESLSTVKSVVLVCDLEHADKLMAEVFRDFFAMVKAGELARKVETYMSDILIALIDESQSLPSEVLESIMAQFLEKASPAGHRLAVEVCKATSDKLQRHVCQYFTDIILSHSPSADDEEAEGDIPTIRTAHSLIHSISLSCPSLLQNVIPQLEEELRVEDLTLRGLATQYLGKMFGNSHTGAELVRKYGSCWKVWQQRKADKSATVRVTWVESCKSFITGSPETRDEIEAALATKLLDPDEKVRAATCRLYADIDYETALHHVSVGQLKAIGDRFMDKKHVVRMEAMIALGRLWSIAWPEIENDDEAAAAHFGWIPQSIFHAASYSVESKYVAEQVIWTSILSLPPKDKLDDEGPWTDRLLAVMKGLDEKATSTLLGLMPLRTVRPSIYERYLQCCVDNNGGVIDENEEQIKRRLAIVIQHLAGTCADAEKAAEDLHAFAKLNEQRLYKLFRTCMDAAVDLKEVGRASAEFLRRIEQSSTSMLGTMSAVLRRAAFWILNTSSITTLLRHVQKQTDYAGPAFKLLTTVSKYCSTMHQSHVGEFIKSLADSQANDQLIEISLGALASMAKAGTWPGDKRVADRAQKYVLGTNMRHAKFAARILAFVPGKEELSGPVIESIAESLEGIDDESLAARTAAIAEFTKAVPEVFETKSDVIIGFLRKDTLEKECIIPPDSDDEDAEDEWIEEDVAPPLLRAKLMALKIFRNRCTSNASSESAGEIAKPILDLLFTIIALSGSLTEEAEDDPRVKCRLRLQAAQCLLHLCSIENYQAAIIPHFTTLAITVQDTCANVRIAFFGKLISYLQARRLDAKFNVIPFLTPHDPEKELREKAKSYVQFALKRGTPEIRLTQFEMIFVRLLHLLAHHPDCDRENLESLQDMSKYIIFYLDLVGTADNHPLLFHLASRMKTVRDADRDKLYSENLYAMSEMAQEIIKARASARGYSLTSYPGKVRLPADLFRLLPNAETATKIHKTSYLPAEAITWLTSEGGKSLKSPKVGL
ncbi:hypothetical protein SISNIDRAFT_420245 [Sistotremastrum niveocremeum HHB9708]|uniref:ARM repeat-containing protein n=1 Tax=Sistotremastrum niveocremeum HHB9708 TaxID=1314777 RepID=A0A164MSP6_9AGAM|nr:hypothetical protein SISNIDRAFT_420245 [Sistotremastrum niveocremeum HHB9708]